MSDSDIHSTGTHAAEPGDGASPRGIAAPTDALREHESLRALIESISSELALRPLLTRIVEHACSLLGAERGSIGLYDEHRDVIRIEAVHHLTENLGAEMPPGVGLAGQILETQQPVILERYAELPQPIYDSLRDESVVGVPILWRNRLIGIFGLGSPPPRRFSQRDADILGLFARHAAIAIENARRYEREQRRTERLALIARIGHIITAELGLDDLIQRTADAIHELLGYPYVAIARRAPDDPGVLEFSAVAGAEVDVAGTKNVRLPWGEGIVGAVAATRRAILSNDVRNDPRYIPTPGTREIQAELAVPIVLGDDLLGVLNAESHERIAEEEATSLRSIADQLAVAIENARLFADSRQALEEARLLYRTSQRISTAMDVDDVIRAYLEEVGEHSACVCSVALYEWNGAGERTSVVVRGRWSPGEGLSMREDRYPYTYDALDPPLDAGQTVKIRDVHTDPRATETLREAQRASKCPALAMIPLLARGRRIGLVVLSHPAATDWPDDILQPYQTTAAQLATAMDSRQQHLLLMERSHEVTALEERQRIARDLHDSVTQLLFSITLIAQSLAGAWRRDPAEGEQRVERLLELSRSALSEMRALLTDWRSSPDASVPGNGRSNGRPGILQARGEDLLTALRRHVAHVTAGGLDVHLDASGYAPQPPDIEEALFRIAQEALNNVEKHAGACRADVRLTMADGYAILVVRDDGRGIPREPTVGTDNSGGIGLSAMRERAEALGGSVRLESEPKRGTAVEVRLPRKEESTR